MSGNALMASLFSDEGLNTAIASLEGRNLRDYRDHETRWLGERMKALRAERRARVARRKKGATS